MQTAETFALYQCKTPVPTNLAAGTKVFPIAAGKVAVLDTTSAAFLEVLGLRSSISEIDSSASVSSPCIQLSKEKGTITEISSQNDTLRRQQIDTIDVAFSAANDSTITKSVGTSAAYDPGVLNRVEWLKFYSAFFNLETKANNYFSQISDNYNCFKNMASKAQKEKPLVAWISYIAPSSFNNNTASWNIADAIYKKQYTEDAGGVYFNSTTLVYSDTTSFLQAIANVDIVIDETYIGSTIDDFYKNYNLAAANQNNYKFVKNKAIYREDGITNAVDGRDWFESAIVMGDAVLEDMINVVNPSLPSTSYKRNWFRNIANGEQIKVLSSANCTAQLQASSIVSKADVCSTIKSDSSTLTSNLAMSISLSVLFSIVLLFMNM